MPVYHYGGYAGTAIALNSYDQQYVNIPYINISHQSFTLEVWFILLPPTGISINQTDFGIFGQCSTDQKCFLVTVRKGHIHVSFDSLANNVTLISSSLVAYYYWVHIAVVYDANALQQRLYINGRLEIISTGIVSPYDGLVTGASAWIGRTKSAAYSLSYFNGYIDHFLLTPNIVKSTCQIYNDATLAFYFPFDSNQTTYDLSIYSYSVITMDTSFVSGRVNQALLFSPTNNSFFQSQCYSYNRQSATYTFSLWIYPQNILRGGSIIHVSFLQNGNGTLCYDLLSLTANGELVVQIVHNTSLTIAVQGPVLPNDTWTHVTVIYSYFSGVRLLLNGTVTNFYPNTVYGLYFYIYTYQQLYITLGNNRPAGAPLPSCLVGSLPIDSGAFSGIIDEFRLFMRELTGDEICQLVNP
ncbi:unnamed protein product [Rotaria sp. Silwood1]|nr:unnamed protein product [Rotaria sp. Silwood1]